MRRFLIACYWLFKHTYTVFSYHTWMLCISNFTAVVYLIHMCTKPGHTWSACMVICFQCNVAVRVLVCSLISIYDYQMRHYSSTRHSRTPLGSMISMIYTKKRIRQETQIVISACCHITPSHYHQYAYLFETNIHINCLSSIFCGLCAHDEIHITLFYLQLTSCDSSANPFHFWWSRWYLYFISLSSSNWKYDSLAIV